jgi:glycolate oxidase
LTTTERPPTETPQIRELAAVLRAALGDNAVIDDHQQLRTYECDGLAQYKVTPALVVLAEDAGSVAQVIAACAERGVRSWPAARAPVSPAGHSPTPRAC